MQELIVFSLLFPSLFGLFSLLLFVVVVYMHGTEHHGMFFCLYGFPEVWSTTGRALLFFHPPFHLPTITKKQKVQRQGGLNEN